MFQTFREAGIDRDEDDVAVEDEDGSGKSQTSQTCKISETSKTSKTSKTCKSSQTSKTCDKKIRKAKHVAVKDEDGSGKKLDKLDKLDM